MQEFIHEKKIKRRGNLGKYAMIGGMLLLVVGFVISLRRDTETVPMLIGLAAAGTIVTQAGSVYFAKYGQNPRPDEVLTDSFKGLSNSHALFHYTLNTDHALLGPSGATAILAYQINGRVTYSNGNFYYQREKGLFGRPRKKKIRNVEKTAEREVRELNKVLNWAFPDRDDIDAQPLVVFVNDDVVVDIDEAPIAAVHAKKAKNAFKRLPRRSGFSTEEIASLASKRGFTAET